MPNTHRNIRWGIAGLGNIAHRFAGDLVHHAENAKLAAVAARDGKRAQEFAAQHGCEISHGSYEALALDNTIDIVYVAVIHPFHRQLVELFLRHGKHVLVEKPAFTNLKDWDDMAALAADKGLLLAEAMKSVAFPAYRELLQFIRDKNIRLTSVQAAFGDPQDFDPTQQIFNKSLCGGATLDVGVYALWLYFDLCRHTDSLPGRPESVNMVIHPEAGVDKTATFVFGGDCKGTLSASITEDLERTARLCGDDIEIIIREKWWNPKSIDITWKGINRSIRHEGAGGGFEYEIGHLSRLIQEGKTQSDVLSHAVSREVIRTMEEGLSANGLAYLTIAG
ncbi:Gfo/Idh/MocA family protein [Salidesulfovibrio onnuriiensis]|uniref:Gfo/Idh/MocA family protein n=1 Tax=Salidesulfovibrio onnuriiensis TaxID=2583823 RepID=UPI0011C808DC|nr:Gfo/Idh/MocA family oxidoreductase [Salidesulfovibrio onnuriiensis]